MAIGLIERAASAREERAQRRPVAPRLSSRDNRTFQYVSLWRALLAVGVTPEEFEAVEHVHYRYIEGVERAVVTIAGIEFWCSAPFSGRIELVGRALCPTCGLPLMSVVVESLADIGDVVRETCQLCELEEGR